LLPGLPFRARFKGRLLWCTPTAGEFQKAKTPKKKFLLVAPLKYTVSGEQLVFLFATGFLGCMGQAKVLAFHVTLSVVA